MLKVSYKGIAMGEIYHIDRDINDPVKFDEFQEIVRDVYNLSGLLVYDEKRDLIHKFEAELSFYLKNMKYIKDEKNQTQIVSALDLYLFYFNINKNRLFSKEKAFNLIQLGFNSIEEALDGMVDDIIHYRVDASTRAIAMVDILTDEQLEYFVYSIIKRYRELEENNPSEFFKSQLTEYLFSEFMWPISESCNLSEDFILEYIEYFDIEKLNSNTNQEKTASIELLMEHMLKN